MSLVVTTSGPVAGRLVDGVRSWRGIPYATAERFGPARPAPSWTGARDATRPGPVGVQPTPAGGLVGVEDCLTLDVYVPDGADGPLPVLFWVHGGAFQTGAAADYDGSVLAARGPAVVVAVSYRLGPFGFLQLGTAEEPEPSPAMTDLLAALAWVQREIGAFGGDPDRLTLVGQSAGREPGLRAAGHRGRPPRPRRRRVLRRRAGAGARGDGGRRRPGARRAGSRGAPTSPACARCPPRRWPRRPPRWPGRRAVSASAASSSARCSTAGWSRPSRSTSSPPGRCATPSCGSARAATR